MTETEGLDKGHEPPAPRANPELLGHAAAERTLLRAFASGRLPHAWLITGPRGIGKATLAFRFARFVLSGGAAPDLLGAPPQSLYVEPADPIFQRVASGGHADLRVLVRGVNEKTGKPRNEIIVDDVRAANGFLRRTAPRNPAAIPDLLDAVTPGRE